MSLWIPIVALVIIIITSNMRVPEYLMAGRLFSVNRENRRENPKAWSQEIQPLDQNKIRLVPPELALSLAKTALSKDGATLGSQFPLSEDLITLQKIKDDYWYFNSIGFQGMECLD